MDTKELLKKVRKIEIKTRRLSNNVFGGEYHSAFKGRGMTFSEVRKYQYGDDIRAIDWNVTARTNEPHIKVFEEERELTMMLMIDVSGSMIFGTQSGLKKNVVAEIAATLAFSAMQNNDKIGVILFTDTIELFIPPKKGRSHVLRIIRELLEYKVSSTKTDIDMAFKYLNRVLKKKAIVFVMSDFIDNQYNQTLKITARKHDLTGLNIHDLRERELPNLGMVHFKDAETGKVRAINTGSKKVRLNYAKNHFEKENYFKESFQKSGAGVILCSTEDDYVKKLLSYFKRR